MIYQFGILHFPQISYIYQKMKWQLSHVSNAWIYHVIKYVLK